MEARGLGITRSSYDELDTVESAFLGELRQHGFAEARNLIVDRYFAEGVAGRYQGFVSELLAKNVDVIVLNNSAAARAAKQLTDRIPIVMAGVTTPERLGLVASLAHPGGNITGVSNLSGGEASSKRLQILKEMLPQLARVGVLWNPANPGSALTLRETEDPAQGLGIALISLGVRGPADLEPALATAVRERIDVLWPHLALYPFRARILAFGADRRLPVVTGAAEWAVGGLS